MGRDEQVRGVVAVIVRDGRLLVIRRAEGIAAAGWWCLPGGGIEAGESPAEALVREMVEEVGLAVRPVRQVWEWERSDGGLHLAFWFAEMDDSDAEVVADPAEVAEARWLTPGEVRELSRLLPSNLAFLDAWEGFGD